jgi:hypothetical protein
LSVSETTAQFVTVFSFDSGSISGGENVPPGAGTATASDTVSLSVAEETSRFVTLTASDVAAIIVTDTVEVTLYKEASDTSPIRVSETSNVFANDVYRTYVYVYRGGTWVEGTMVQWHNGAWRPVIVATYKNGAWVDNSYHG